MILFSVPVHAQVVVTPTIYCVGGVGAPPCAPIPSSQVPTNTMPPLPSETMQPSGGTSTNPSPTSITPCETGQTSVQRHGRKKHKNSNGLFKNFILELLKMIEELLGKLGIQMPNSGEPATQEPTQPTQPAQPIEPTQPIEPNPCPDVVTPQPTATVAPTVGTEPTATVAPITPAPTTGAGGGTSAAVKITFYGSYDNDPKGSLAIAFPVLHQQAGGVGTFQDPLSFASPVGDGAYPVGQIIYVPMVQKYFIKEDECAVSWTAPNGCGAVTMVDLYVGNPSSAEVVVDCEDSLTPSGNTEIILNPPATLTYDPTPIWNQSTGACMTPH